jgi:phosphate/sulfate permease
METSGPLTFLVTWPVPLPARPAKWKPVFGILLSWIITLPCAAIFAAICYLALRKQ